MIKKSTIFVYVSYDLIWVFKMNRKNELKLVYGKKAGTKRSHRRKINIYAILEHIRKKYAGYPIKYIYNS